VSGAAGPGTARRGVWLPPALVFAVLAVVYGATLCRTVGPGDAGELTSVLCSWGVAHPPGFPLLSLLGNLVSALPLPGEPALALNALNALFAALACAVLAHAVGVATGSRWAGAVAGLLLGTSRTFWEYALVIEVFSLNALLAALLIDLLALWLEARGRGEAPRALPAAAAAVMAGVLTHHTTLVLVAAPVAVAFVAASLPRRAKPRPNDRRGGPPPAPAAAPAETLVPALLAGLLALAPLLYLPLAAAFDPPFSWGDARSPQGLLDMLMRRDFGTGTLMAPAIVANELLVRGESASPIGMRHFLRLLTELPQTVGWPALGLAAVGIVAVARRRRAWLLPTLLFFAAVALFYTRVNAPMTPLYLGITRPFALLPHLELAFLAGWGLAWAGSAAPAIRAGVFALVVLHTGIVAGMRWREVDQHRNTFSRDFGVNFVTGMPERALVFSTGDYFRNTLLYARLGLGLRPDLTQIEQPLLSRRWYVDQLRRRGSLALPPQMRVLGRDSTSNIRALLVENIERHPIVTVGLHDQSWVAEFADLPMGLWARVDRHGRTPPVGDWARAYAEAVAGWRVESLADSFAESTWEDSQGRFYPYALGSLRALLDMSAALGSPVETPVPAMAAAERWRGVRRGQYLADQADLWRRFLTDWRDASTFSLDSLVAERAVTLARASQAVDSTQLQALQTLAAVMGAAERVPAAARYRDRFEEIAIRRRIVEIRPGDPEEVRAYLTLARSLASDPDPRVPELLRRAEQDRQRYLRLLNLARRIYPAPLLERRMREWDTPIGP